MLGRLTLQFARTGPGSNWKIPHIRTLSVPSKLRMVGHTGDVHPQNGPPAAPLSTGFPRSPTPYSLRGNKAEGAPGLSHRRLLCSFLVLVLPSCRAQTYHLPQVLACSGISSHSTPSLFYHLENGVIIPPGVKNESLSK